MAILAEPILASTLWETTQTATGEASNATRSQASTGCLSIDNAVGRAVQYGSVCCVSTEAQGVGRELCQAFVASHLLNYPDGKATVVDTALSFDVRKFHRTLVARLEGQAAAEQRAMNALERLQIMKAFDFEGLTESFSEVRNALEGKQSGTEVISEGIPASRGTIEDSEDEDEMLDSPSPPAHLQLVPQQTRVDEQAPAKGLLMINSISHVAAPMIKNRHVEGQALLISFMRSLTHLTTTHQLLTIVLNDAIQKANVKDESPSAFSSCTVRPALGRSFEYMLDTHLLVHSATSRNTSNQQARASTQTGDEKVVSVVEVLQDRNGDALGRWAAFTVNDAGTLTVA